MQSSMWSFLQKKEGGEIEDVENKISTSKKESNTKPTSPKKKKAAETKTTTTKKDTKKQPKKETNDKKGKKVEQEEEKDEIEDEDEELQEEEEEIEEKPKKKNNKKGKKPVEEDEQEEEDQMDLDENEKESKKKSSTKTNDKKGKKESSAKPTTQLKRLKRKVMEESDNENNGNDDDLDNLLNDDHENNDNQKETDKKHKEKEKKEKDQKEKDQKEKELKELEIKQQKEKDQKEKEEKDKKEKEQKEKEKETTSPKKQSIDIADLFKKAATTTPKPTTTTTTSSKKQKVDHKNNKSPVKQTTTSTATKEKEVEKEIKKVEEKKEETEEEEQEQEKLDEIEGEEEEYEEEEYEEEEISEDEGEKKEGGDGKVKTKFVKKVPISKKKGNAKSIQADLKVIGKYDPIKDATWKKGEQLPYMVLAKTFELMESTSSRLIIIEYLTNLFRSLLLLSPKELVMVIYLSINKIGPSYHSKELGIGDHVLIKAVAESTGRSVDIIKQELTEVGDLGIIAQNSRMTQPTMFPPPPLTITSVFKTFQAIAEHSGTGGQKKKMDLIKKLLTSCKDCETLYIIRSLQGKLRIGLAERSVLMALAKAILVSPPTPEEGSNKPTIIDIRKTMKQEEFEELHQKTVAKVTRAYSQLPNYDLFVPHLTAVNGIDNILSTCSLSVGIPVKPMLAQPTTGISQMLDRFSDMEFTCEFKYDGERAQIHRLPDGTTRIYTRNLEDYTGKYPDVIENVNKFIGKDVKSFILDCEAVAFDAQTKKILSFQVLSTRARKSVQLSQIKVPVCVFAFDLLYLNGKSLIDEPLITRRKILTENFNEVQGVFSYAKYANISDVNEIQLYLEEAIEGNCEGLMVKTLKEKSIYEPSRRSYNWLKIKKDYMQGMTDSLDLVPIGAWYGKGKRTGTFGAYLLACYDENNEEFQTLCKIGTGFSDDQLTNFTNELKPHVINQPRNQFRVSDTLKPDVWLSPSQVWEVLAADLSISPVHTAATGTLDPNKGIALRFPRFIRIRPDKSPEDATSSEQVVDMYQNQKINNQSNKKNDEKDEDY